MIDSLRLILIFTFLNIRHTRGILRSLKPCFLPKDPGSCKLCVTRWYFDTKTFQCEPFVYGGCNGNENNFENHVECVQRCVEGIRAYTCSLPATSGRFCATPVTRFYFSLEKISCQPFVFYGCHGNWNNFRSVSGCEDYCIYKR